ncbi:MAG: 50S ribosomal protein L11 methyltransferase [Rubellimicrobium sp.]|nr:50S ribosomal protein L11 methyltransferase [Rubellimicrobium sp.]
MAIYSAITTLPGQAAAEALAETLDALELPPAALGVFEVEDGSGLYEVAAYFEERPDGVVLALIAASHGARDFAVSEVPDVDWVAHVRRELAPVEAGRFIVHGSHDADHLPEGRIALLIEAAMAFGTGHHGTTLGCLLALDRLADEGVVAPKVADVGCGTAVLAMAAARLWGEALSAPVLAADIDPVAVEVASANVVANGLSDKVHCLEAAGFDAPRIAAAAPFDLVFANILKGPLITLAPAMATHVVPGGWVILSGILNEQADEVQEVYARAGFNPGYRDRIGEWTTLCLRRIS